MMIKLITMAPLLALPNQILSPREEKMPTFDDRIDGNSEEREGRPK